MRESPLFRRYGAIPLLSRGAIPPGPVGKPANWARTLPRLWRYLAEYRVRLGAILCSVVLLAALVLLAPYLLGVAIDALLVEPPQGSPLRLIALLAGVYLAQLAVSMAQSHAMIGIAQRAVMAIRRDVFTRLHALPMAYYATRHAGEIASRLTNDLDNLGQTLSQAVLRIGTSLVVFVGMLGLMVWLNPVLAGVSLIVVPMMFVGARWVGARTPLLFKRQQADVGALVGFLDETLSAQLASKAFGREEAAIAAFEGYNGRLRVSAYWAQTYSGFVSKLMYICDNLSFSLILVIGGVLALHGQVSIGVIVTFGEYARQFSRQLNQVSTQINTVLAAVAGAERAFELLDEDTEPDGTLGLDTVRGDIRFEGVGFAYGQGATVLDDVDLHIPAGTTLALIGPTGAGKSTVVQLLSRFHDVSAGRILVDGHDLRDLRRADLRRQMGFVLQEPLLFNASVRDNVRYARVEASDAEVERACRLANAHAFIEKLPQGYDTLLRHEGGDISQGQRQLLTIARAILADPRILILDEATSSIDSLTEAHIQEALAHLMRGRTCLVIAHRLHTIRHAEQILVLDRGRVVERGCHETLIADGGLYARLYGQSPAAPT
ncbi:ABC transporter ATP-binding protein [Pseudomonas sp. RIT-PI-AD]|uniref:ABC transporter ATP-binding protein n=1 Tax=Pseudomonas sp. RIT-PI-AD TaxID=3035294 RepID=UPI0021D841AB|nr:ABC transporter ATP-binding protein [Pseudomonas sp. RIT-PI-AD]